MPATLYRRQRQILEYIQKFIKDNGYGPTLMEIGKKMGLSSPATVHEHLKTLEKKGFIKRNSNEVRGIQVLGIYENFEMAQAIAGVELPLLGYINAGKPLEPYENHTATFKVTANLVPQNKTAFVLQVKGDSMIEDGILQGDFVVLVKEENINNGDIVVALLETGLATLKRFFRENGQIKLMPANSTMQPIYATNVQVQGKLVALIRKYV